MCALRCLFTIITVITDHLPAVFKFYLFLVVLGLYYSCGKWGLLSPCSSQLPIEVASREAERRLEGTQASGTVVRRLRSCGFQALGHGFNRCGARASLLGGMWDLPRYGIKPVSPALVGGFFTTEPHREAPSVF